MPDMAAAPRKAVPMGASQLPPLEKLTVPLSQSSAHPTTVPAATFCPNGSDTAPCHASWRPPSKAQLCAQSPTPWWAGTLPSGAHGSLPLGPLLFSVALLSLAAVVLSLLLLSLRRWKRWSA